MLASTLDPGPEATFQPRREDRRASIAGTPWFRSVAANPLADPEHVVTAMLRAVRE